MCEYCEFRSDGMAEEAIGGYGAERFAYVRKTGKVFVLSANYNRLVNGSVCSACITVPIDCCPMCGRDLIGGDHG